MGRDDFYPAFRKKVRQANFYTAYTESWYSVITVFLCPFFKEKKQFELKCKEKIKGIAPQSLV